jgi:predicted nucleic acid-binding protein
LSYLDASALLPLFLAGGHTARMRRRVAPDQPPVSVSVFGIAEIGAVVTSRVRARILTREAGDGLLASIDAWLASMAAIHPVDGADHDHAAAFVRRFDLGLRAPDALHLATCRRLGLPLLTFDARQAAAARRLGITCDPAGA